MPTTTTTTTRPTRYGQTDTRKSAKKSASPYGQTEMPKMIPEINERFKSIREEMGITQTELAEALSEPGKRVTLSTIKSIENKVVSPNLYIVRRLKQVSGKSYNYILEGIGR